MSRSEERELFLKYVSDTYLKNPNLSISKDIIYCVLSRFCIINDERVTIKNDSLLGVQVGINNRFKNNPNVDTFSSSDGYFLVIENRCGKSDEEYYSFMLDSIKLYVSVDPENVFKISELLFNYMIENNIVMQCKISKNMRNDALVCRVSGIKEVNLVCDYLNNLNYESKYKPNPFLIDSGKVSMTIDWKLSYNQVLSLLLCEYLKIKKSINKLDAVNVDDFSNFINSQIKMFNSKQKKTYMNLYGINKEDKLKYFIIICNLILKNMNDSLSIDDLFMYSEINNTDVLSNDVHYSKQDEDKILYVINSLTNYYSMDVVHKIIMEYIETDDVDVFTRKDGIRAIVSENFTSKDFNNIISDIGYKTFISACSITYEKYDDKQVFSAIERFFNNGNLKGFTNDYNVRSRLGLVIPYELLKKVLIYKLKADELDISAISLANIVFDEIDKKNHSRK